MRILFFAAFFDFRGEPTNLADEVKSVAKIFPHIQYLVYTIGPLNKINRVVKYDKNILLIERKNLRNINQIKLFLKDIFKIFTKFKPDLIHSVYVVESIIMGFFSILFRIPSILHGRGTDINIYPFRSLRWYILAKIAYTLNKKIITVSKAMKKNVMRLNVKGSKIIPIYDGLNFNDFKLIEKRENRENNRFEILHAGRFSPEKRQDLILEICKILKDNNQDFHLTLIGYGPLENYLKNLIKKYDLEESVSFEGFIKHNKISSYFQKADLYIQPSTSEGMPKSVYEAMSMELPIVMTRVGGMVELNIKPGVILIDKNDKKGFYDAILWFINHPGDCLIGGKKNREFILKNFNWEIHAKKLYNTYLELIKI